VTEGDDPVAVQVKRVPATCESSVRAVDVPEQIALERGVLDRSGTGKTVTT